MKRIILFTILFLILSVQTAFAIVVVVPHHAPEPQDSGWNSIVKADGYVICEMPRNDGCEIPDGAWNPYKKISWEEYLSREISYPVDIIGISYQNGRVLIYFRKK